MRFLVLLHFFVFVWNGINLCLFLIRSLFIMTGKERNMFKWLTPSFHFTHSHFLEQYKVIYINIFPRKELCVVYICINELCKLLILILKSVFWVIVGWSFHRYNQVLWKNFCHLQHIFYLFSLSMFLDNV